HGLRRLHLEREVVGTGRDHDVGREAIELGTEREAAVPDEYAQTIALDALGPVAADEAVEDGYFRRRGGHDPHRIAPIGLHVVQEEDEPGGAALARRREGECGRLRVRPERRWEAPIGVVGAL